jgi:iron complex transport system permease protein
MPLTDREPNYKLRFTVLSSLFVVVFFGSFMIGRYPIDPVTLVKIILSRFLPIAQTWEDAAWNVVFQIRLPRVAAAGVIGAALSAAGAAYQGMFRNPMVSPDILGASSGAGYGAALAIFLHFGYWGISISAFVTGLGAMLLTMLISRASRLNPVLSLVLAGIMVGSLFSSCTSYIKLIADTLNTLPAITFWLMGSLVSIKPDDLLFVTIPVLLGMVPLILLRWRINLLTVSEDEAKSLGIHTGMLRAIVIVCATLMTAASVSVSGMIGWVGLVIPHFGRMIFGVDFRRLIPASILMGASFLIVVDNVARTITTNEIPIGILTSFIGAPVFVCLILRGGANRE